MPELVSQGEYARRRGVSQQAVSKALKAGRIAAVNGKIDPAQADAQWRRRTNPGQAMRSAAIAAGARLDQGGAPAGLERGEGGAKGGQTGVDYGQQRAIHEGYRARLAKVEYERQIGKLVELDVVRVKWFNTLRNGRNVILGMPDQLSAILAGESNQFEVHRILLEHCRRVCTSLADQSKP
jgi:hypothetical protein